MAEKTKYIIELDIQNSDKVNAAMDSVERTLKSVSDDAKKLNFDSALDSVKALEQQMNSLYESEGDVTQQIKSFERASNKAYTELERQAVRLNHAISEQGKAQRERIAELEKERASLNNTAEAKARQKEIDAELKDLRKQVVNASDEELDRMLKQNVQARARLKLMQQEAKNQEQSQKQQKTLAQLVKEDLKPLQEKLKLQKEFIASLKTTEGRYAAIKKAAKGALSVGGKAIKGAAGVAGAALAIGGMAVASAGKQVDQEREARRIKGAGSLEDKQNMMFDLYAKTGADYSTIVDAINRCYSVLGNVSRSDMTEAATAEIKMPGAASLFRQQNSGPVAAKDFTAYLNRMRSMQGLTGASQEQITSSTEYISNLRQNSFTNASETELQTLYLALQNSGAFDTEEELQRAFQSFVRKQKGSGVDVFSLAQQWQNSGEWTRTADGAMNETQAQNTIKNLDFKGMGEASRVTDYAQPEETAAEKTARELREFEVQKDKLLMDLLKALRPLLENGTLQNLATSLTDLVGALLPVISPIMDALNNIVELVSEVVGWISMSPEERDKKTKEMAEKANAEMRKNSVAPLVGEELSDFFNNLLFSDDDLDIIGRPRANGGVVSMPSICGESGSEMVIPLDSARRGRGFQLLQQVEQTFNMGNGETTAQSLAQAVRSRSFMYETGRINALNHRMGV